MQEHRYFICIWYIHHDAYRLFTKTTYTETKKLSNTLQIRILITETHVEINT